jgi:hypothetical protein
MKPGKNIEEYIIILTSKPLAIIIAALVVACIYIMIYCTVLYLIGMQPSNTLTIIGIIIFAISSISITLEYAEIQIASRNEDRKHPPIQFFFILIISYIFVFIIVPEYPFVTQAKTHIITLTLLAFPAAAIALVYHRVSKLMFFAIIRNFFKLSESRILDSKTIETQIDNKIDEVKRYGGMFSIIVIFTDEPGSKNKTVYTTLQYHAFLLKIQNNIRRSDLLGIPAKAMYAIVFSNGNDIPKAEIQAARLFDLISKDRKIIPEIKAEKTKVYYGIAQFDKEIVSYKALIEKAQADLGKRFDYRPRAKND